MRVVLDVADKVLKGLLCSAFEGGSSYWIVRIEAHYPKGAALVLDGFTEAMAAPFCVGSYTLVVERREGEHSKQHQLTWKKAERGLEIMAREYPRHFANVLSGEDDAETGDVFLQCCLFGEVVYG